MKIFRKIVHDILIFISPPFIRKKLLSCEEVSHILAQKQDLHLIKDLQFRVHMFICKNCLNYQAQIKFLDSQVKKSNLSKVDSFQENRCHSQQAELIKKLTEKSK